MAYILGQYNKNGGIVADGEFMTIIPNGWHSRKSTASSQTAEADLEFQNECCGINTVSSRETFEIGVNYYFHGKVLKAQKQQVFYVKLVDYVEDENSVQQYIKTITIPAMTTLPAQWQDAWVDIEFVFTPIHTFDTLVFELKRETTDYIDPRFCNFAFLELSTVENIIGTQKIPTARNLIKLGLQSHPGLLMCINGEAIHNSRSGIYELKNGVVLVTSFSVLSPGKEAEDPETELTPSEAWMQTTYNEVTSGTRTAEDVGSECFFNTDKTRTIDSFSLDYMFKEKEEAEGNGS